MDQTSPTKFHHDDIFQHPQIRMSSPRALAIVAGAFVGAFVLAIAVASAQGVNVSDDPFENIDLNALKKNGPAARDTPATSESPATSPKDPPRAVRRLFSNGNDLPVRNRPRRATSFTLKSAATIAQITTYHWNNGRGARPGTIGLRSGSGQVWGPWQATGAPGQGGIPDAYWTAAPNVNLPAGTYTVIDSDPSTWAQNNYTDLAGMAWGDGY